VAVATVTTGEMPITAAGLGTVTPLASVTVRSQLSGYLTSVAFREGQMVHKGDILATIAIAPCRYRHCPRWITRRSR
jgi:multidrug efflux system membrane fusion protein